jgi:TolB-like protein/Flp pilus assembly protein TadD
MADTGSQLQSNSGEQRASARLDSWKEIAAYLRRDVRTVQRWERSEGLPVHRHLHDKQGTVYAYQSELDAWWHGRQTTADPGMRGEPASVSATAATEAENRERAAQSAHPHRRWTAPVVVALLLAIGLAGYVFRKRTLAPGPGKVTVAVLPFNDLNANDPEQQYFAAGLSEEMMARLAQVNPGRLRVVRLTAAYRDRSLRQIGDEFKADYVLDGSVRRAGNRVAIAGELLQIRDQSQVWADSYDRDLRDVLSIQSEVASAIARAVSGQLPSSTPNLPQLDPAAYEAYLKGRFFWNKRTPDDLLKAVAYFQRAVSRQPNYAAAYSGLADCYGLLGSVPYAVLPPREAFPKAKAAAEKALQLDPNLAEAHVSLSYVRLVYDWDAAGAESELRRALELRPDYATAHQFYGYYLSATGRLDQAIRERQRAQELDPLSPVITASLGEAYYLSGQFAKSIEQYKKSLELDPNFAIAIINMGRSEIQMGHHQAAAELFRSALKERPNDPGLLMLVGYDQGVAGDRSGARASLQQLERISPHRYVPALYMAAIHTGLGDKDQASQWLQKAYDERCDYLVYLWAEPAAQSLRSDPRFALLLSRIPLRHD